MNYKQMAVFNTVGNVTYLLCLWLLTVFVTRVAGYEAAGIFALAISVVNVVVSFQMFGVRSYQVSDVRGEYCGEQYVFGRYFTTVVGLLLCVTYCLLMDYTANVTAIILSYALYRSAEAVADVYWGELQKIGRLDIAAKSLIARGCALIMLNVLALYWGGELYVGLSLSALMAAFITIVYDRAAYLRLTGQGGISLSLHQMLEPLFPCFNLLLTTMFPMIVVALPRIFLERYNGAELLGYYGNVSAPTVLISSMVPSVLVPIMTWYGELFQSREEKKILHGFILSLFACVFLGIMACVAVWVAGEWVMSFVFTRAIFPYVHYLYPLIWSTVIYAWTMCANAVLISVRETHAVTIFSTAALLTAGVISNQLVKELAIPGAILTLMAAYTLQFLLQLIWIVIWYHRMGKTD